MVWKTVGIVDVGTQVEAKWNPQVDLHNAFWSTSNRQCQIIWKLFVSPEEKIMAGVSNKIQAPNDMYSLTLFFQVALGFFSKCIIAIYLFIYLNLGRGRVEN